MTGLARKIDELTELFRSDALTPTSAVFPSIDSDRIARQLAVNRKATERGSNDLPRSDEESLDSVEVTIIEAVEEQRRNGLEAYENNKEVYSRRLSQASTARMRVKGVAGKAEGDFAAEVKESRGHMSGLIDELREWQAALRSFREANRLTRPAYADSSVGKTAVILFLCVVAETVLNGYLFAQKNELGLLGGGMIAALVSTVNVGLSSYAGYFSRLSRDVRFVPKIWGMVIVGGWICLIGILNLAIAHFRDAIETLGNWSQAVHTSLEGFRQAPFALSSMESWLLMIVGCLVALAAFLKLRSVGDPYPGYGRISRRYEAARDDYAHALSDALDGLQEKRDAAIAELEEVNRLVRDSIGDAIDALYGQRLMRAHLKQFLEQCDLKANVLLKSYRDENRAARKTPPPKHFDASYTFAEFADSTIEGDHRLAAEKEVEEIGKTIDAAIEAIHEHYRSMIDEFPDPHELLNIYLPSKHGESVRPEDGVEVGRLKMVGAAHRS